MRSGDQRPEIKDQTPEIKNQSLQVIPDDVRVWLLHKGGYTQARLLERLPDGRARITVAGEYRFFI